MKGHVGSGDKHGRGRLPVLQQPESMLRRVSVVVVGCFLFVLVLLASSRRGVAVFFLDTLSPEKSLRAPAAAEITLRSSSAGHEVIRDTTVAAAGTTNGGVERDAKTEESSAAAAAWTSNSEDRTASPAMSSASARRSNPTAARTPILTWNSKTGAAEPVQDKAAHVTAVAGAVQPATETTSAHPRDTGVITRRADSMERRRRPPLCDFSGARADVCDFAGDIRLDANASTFVVVVDDDDPAAGVADGTTTTHKVRPYPRKGDATAMGRVTELTVRTTSDATSAPQCTTTHAAPALAFSVSGYAGNLFHDFTDVIVPLFAAAERYRGNVRLVVTDAAASRGRWLARYGALLRGLSHHAPLDLAKAGAAGEVHCFRRAVVGLRGHRELLIQEGPPGMPDFGRFLRYALSLPRDAPTRLGGSDGSGVKKPRLLIISRRGTRRLLNADAVARAAEEVGFETVTRELNPADDVAQVGTFINSFDAVVGVHGAGLTNMVFLPPGATLVQIVPWGGLRWIARLDFGDAAEAMGLRYVQYEVTVEESTLKDKYPRDHEVFTNPTALHRKGFTFIRHTFLNGQDVVLDVERFRPVLLQALRNLAR